MNRFVALLIELLILLAIWLLSLGLTAPLRRWLSSRQSGASRLTSGLLALTTFLIRPAGVLLLTYPVLWLLKTSTPIASFLAANPQHVAAWQVFWLVVLVISLLEGIAQLSYDIRDEPFPVPDLLRNIIRGLLILAIGFAVLRIELGIDIAPLLASTALLTAVIGFALQGVLGNLLAGMSLHVVRSVIPSDWIAIDNQLEGRVIQTNWRETRLRTREGHIMIVPNGKVARATIHNMTRPTPLRRHQINVGASYSDAPAEVIAALIEAAQDIPEVLQQPSPSAFITGFEDYGINYQLRFWTNRYFHRPPIDGNVSRMIWYKFKRRGIEIPFPMSDKLLNDFMQVVYHQRRLPLEDQDIQACVTDLMASDFHMKLCVDADGRPLLGEEDFAQIAPAVRRQQYTRGEILFRQGDAGEHFYVLVRGKLRGRMEHAADGSVTRFELGPGAMLGEMSLLTELPRTATIKVLEESELLELGPTTFRKLLLLHDNIPEALAQLASERAAANAEAYAELKDLQTAEVKQKTERGHILRRFLRLIGKS